MVNPNSTTEGTDDTSSDSQTVQTTMNIKSSHPLFLHPSDSPDTILVNTIFDGKIYGGWRRAVFIALSAKNKLGFVDGLIIECIDMVISWLLNSHSKDIAESVLYSKTSRSIWKELEDRFACDCSCGGKSKAFKSQQDSRLIQFLMGLNETYSGVKSNILLVSPLPSVNHTYSLLIQDEKQREMHVEYHKPFNVDRRGDSKAKRNHLICSHCKKVGNSFDKCYRIIGFPADFKFTKGKRMQFGNVYGNAATMNDNEGSHFVPTLEKGITEEQYNHLCQLLQQVNMILKRR
ncbi:hypothetical protein R3W88_016416 [Solanum pinnatisectum]|uniref:Retrotransposon Copia-like N-terminal domain-containing protein n=1 Tax=Solanum pinnatisectum TaxID=50273 RepID=A0AAV9KYQ2_9SOLN|nr:hypothetical protein R3W88_016416 [Solanum pinnatisectum]